MTSTPELFNRFGAALNRATDFEAQSKAWGPLDVARLLLEVSDRCHELGDFHKRNGAPMFAAQCFAQARRCVRASEILIEGEGEA